MLANREHTFHSELLGHSGEIVQASTEILGICVMYCTLQQTCHKHTNPTSVKSMLPSGSSLSSHTVSLEEKHRGTVEFCSKPQQKSS